MTVSQLKHSPVFFKLLHLEPTAGTIADISEHGVWFASDELLKEIRGNYPLPPTLQSAPKLAVFVPFSGIEWMVGAE
jgi:hypothetical protein